MTQAMTLTDGMFRRLQTHGLKVALIGLPFVLLLMVLWSLVAAADSMILSLAVSLAGQFVLSIYAFVLVRQCTRSEQRGEENVVATLVRYLLFVVVTLVALLFATMVAGFLIAFVYGAAGVGLGFPRLGVEQMALSGRLLFEWLVLIGVLLVSIRLWPFFIDVAAGGSMGLDDCWAAMAEHQTEARKVLLLVAAPYAVAIMVTVGLESVDAVTGWFAPWLNMGLLAIGLVASMALATFAALAASAMIDTNRKRDAFT